MQPENELIETRLAKLRALREAGRDPFAVERYPRTHTAEAARKAYLDAEAAAGGDVGAIPTIEAAVAGRVTNRRVMGKASFLDLEDLSGRLQLYCKADRMGPGEYTHLDSLDTGDFIGARGTLFRTRAGE